MTSWTVCWVVLAILIVGLFCSIGFRLRAKKLREDARMRLPGARAFDTSGNESGDSIEVPYEPVPNVPPTADAGPDRSVSEGETVMLDGSNSSDEDGSIVSYEWTQTLGTSVGLSDPASVTPSFTAC